MARRRDKLPLKPQIPTKYTSNIGGMIENRSQRFIQPTNALDIVNMHANEEGAWSVRLQGYDNLNASAYESGAKINGGFWFTNSAGTDSLIVACNSKLLTINTGDGTATVSDASAGFDLNLSVTFAQLNSKAYMVDGTIAAPRTWTGSVAGNASGWPVSDGVNNYSKPKIAVVHNNRLVTANYDGFKSTLIASNFNDGETYTLPATTSNHAFAATCAPGDGQEITCLLPIFVSSQNQDNLIVFKGRKTFLMTGSNPVLTGSDPFRIVLANATYGCINQRSAVRIGNDIISVSELEGGGLGLISFTSATENGTFQPVALNSDIVKDTLARVNRTYLSKIWAMHLPLRREVWFGLPTGSSTVVNEYLVYKYGLSEEFENKWSRRKGHLHNYGLTYQNRTFLLADNGYIADMFVSSSYDGSPIQWEYHYPPLDFGQEKLIKRITDARAIFNLTGSQTITVGTSWRGGGNNDSSSQSVTLDPGLSSSLYGTAVYGTSTYGDTIEVKKQFKVFGNGERLIIDIIGSSVAQSPEFLGILLDVEPGGRSVHYN